MYKSTTMVINKEHGRVHYGIMGKFRYLCMCALCVNNSVNLIGSILNFALAKNMATYYR